MSNKDYAILNYYLTILRGILVKSLEDINDNNIRKDYIEKINYINEIMKFHILGGEDNE